jgi:iron complex outermembrane recepter protein
VGAFPDGTARGGLFVVTGNPELQPERAESYEAGYRWQAAPNVSFDATAFHNQMRGLVGTTTSRPFVGASGRTTIALQFENDTHGRANGAEFFLTDAVTPNWNVTLGYSFLQMSTIDDDLETNGKLTAPRHQLQLRSFIQLPRQLELDSSAFYVGRIGSNVQPYLRLDEQLSWHLAKRLELSISGQNLLHARHTEFVGNPIESVLVTPAQRTVNGRVTWHF